MFLERVGQRELVAAGDGQLEIRSVVPHLQHMESLSALENVPSVARHARDRMSGAKTLTECVPHCHPPGTRHRRVFASQSHDVVRHLDELLRR